MIRHAAVLLTVFALGAPPVLAQEDPGPRLPGWAEDGVCYEVFVRSFYDGDGDGIGDLRGLIAKLDYVNDGDSASERSLGANCIWLMPIAQSTSYHSYDVENYFHVDRAYGTNEDFRALMAKANRRGIHVIKDLVLNHVSREHLWFRSAVFHEGSPYRDWFIWTDEPVEFPDWEHPIWHEYETGDDYYYGFFWSGMPDLNLANPDVTGELENVARFWLEEMRVDGFRLDAVAHLFEEFGVEGGWKHVEENHGWLRDFGAHVRRVAPDAFTIGEVWDATDGILPYYPDQLDAYFIFEVADALVNAARGGSAAELHRAVKRIHEAVPAGRWSPFLRNHDQTRTMTELGGDERRARLAATLLLTMPGLPFLYYGEEIGMTGDKPDPRLRTPMHWTLGRAAGFTEGDPWEPLQPDSLTANVEAQEGDPGSLLNHHRRLVHLRARHPGISASGAYVPLETGNDQVAAYLRTTGDGAALVLANLTEQPLRDIALSSTEGALPPGRYRARSLLGEADEGDLLRVGEDGRIHEWRVMPVLDPLESYVFDLTR